jgi:hypothetical protein
MKKIIILTAALFIVINSFAAFPIPVVAEQPPAEVQVRPEKPSIQAIESMSAQEFEKLTGKKLNFIERFVFKIQKKRLIGKMKKAEPSSFNIGGFILGLLYGPFGLLAAYIFSKSTNFRKSAYLGFKIWLLVVLVVAIVFLAIAGGKFR